MPQAIDASCTIIVAKNIVVEISHIHALITYLVTRYINSSAQVLSNPTSPLLLGHLRFYRYPRHDKFPQQTLKFARFFLGDRQNFGEDTDSIPLS